jgi:hypothetical protein
MSINAGGGSMHALVVIPVAVIASLVWQFVSVSLAEAAPLDEIRALLEAQTATLHKQQDALRRLQEQNDELRRLMAQHLKRSREEASAAVAVPEPPQAQHAPEVPPASPPPSAEEWQFSVGPRVAYRTFSPLLPQNNPTFQASLQDLDFMTGGVTLTVAPPGWNASELLFTVLYGGGGHSEWRGLAADTPGAIRGQTDNKLLDIELLYRQAFQHVNAQWYAGLQYIGLDFNVDLGRTVSSLGRTIVQGGETFLAKAGVGGFFPLSEDGEHRIFSNVLLAAGFLTVDNQLLGKDAAFTLGWDVNVGYQWVINPRHALSARYRGQFLHSFGLTKLEDGFEVLHGPEVQYSYRW